MKTKNRMRFQYIYDFTLLEKIISEGLIAKINSSKNEINFQLLETNTKEKKMVFKSKNLLGQLVCDV